MLTEGRPWDIPGKCLHFLEHPYLVSESIAEDIKSEQTRQLAKLQNDTHRNVCRSSVIQWHRPRVKALPAFVLVHERLVCS